MSVPTSVNFRRIWPLQATAATLLVAGGLHFTLTPAHAQAIGFSQAELGTIGAAYYVGFLISSMLNPLAFRALGHRALFPLCAVAIAVTVAAQPLLPGVAGWIVLRGLVGFLAAGMFGAVESWLNAIASNANRGRTISIYSMGNQAALAAAQYLFVLFPAESGTGFYVSAAILVLTIAPFSAMRGPAPPPPAQLRVRVATLARGSPVAFAGFLCNGAATAPFWVLGPVFARDQGFDQLWIGVFMSLPILGSLLTQYQIARASDRMDRRRVILPVAFAAAAAAALVALAAQFGQTWGIYVGVVLFGMMAFSLNTLCSSHMNDRVGAEELTEAAGASYLVYGVASAIGPLIASLAMQLVGPAGLFWHAAMVLSLFGLFTLTRLLVRASAQTEDQTV